MLSSSLNDHVHAIHHGSARRDGAGANIYVFPELKVLKYLQMYEYSAYSPYISGKKYSVSQKICHRILTEVQNIKTIFETGFADFVENS